MSQVRSEAMQTILVPVQSHRAARLWMQQGQQCRESWMKRSHSTQNTLRHEGQTNACGRRKRVRTGAVAHNTPRHTTAHPSVCRGPNVDSTHTFILQLSLTGFTEPETKPEPLQNCTHRVHVRVHVGTCCPAAPPPDSPRTAAGGTGDGRSGPGEGRTPGSDLRHQSRGSA